MEQKDRKQMDYNVRKCTYQIDATYQIRRLIQRKTYKIS